jgi:hypothetical protein
MRRHGIPDAVLTDNGKVFTGRFEVTKTEVLFDRICRENGVRHLLTAPYSPTTTGKIERLQQTMRPSSSAWPGPPPSRRSGPPWTVGCSTTTASTGSTRASATSRRLAASPWAQSRPREFVIDKDPGKNRAPATPASAMRPPPGWLAETAECIWPAIATRSDAGSPVRPSTSFAAMPWRRSSTGGVLVVSHVARHKSGAPSSNASRSTPWLRRPKPRAGDCTATVTRLVDHGGNISFAGALSKAPASRLHLPNEASNGIPKTLSRP